MKKVSFLLALLFLLVGTVCFATDTEDTVVADNPADQGTTVNLDDYDDFYNAYNEAGTQDEIREYYRQFLAYSREQDAKATGSQTVKAKVLSTKAVKETYTMNYYTPYQFSYQPITVEILEGEYKGKILDVQYVLTADTYGNIKIPTTKTGDTIYVVTELQEGSSEVGAYTGSHDSRVSRFYMAVILLIVVACIVCIVGKLRGLKTLLLIALIFDLVFLVTVPIIVRDNQSVILESGDARFPTKEEIAADTSIAILSEDDNSNPTKVEIFKKSNLAVWIMILDIIVITAVSVINKLGLTKKTLKAFGITACILLLTGLLLFGVNIITEMNGNTFEAISTAENIINKNIDFAAIYIFTSLIIASVVVSNIVSRVVMNDDEEVKNFLMGQLGLIAVISLMFLFAKVITLVVFKYSVKELMNSEMLLLEVVRMLLLMIAATCAVPLTKLICHKGNDENI